MLIDKYLKNLLSLPVILQKKLRLILKISRTSYQTLMEPQPHEKTNRF